MIKSGDIFAQRHHGPISDLIRDGTGETWSHVGTIWVKPDGSKWAFQAHYEGGTECVPLTSVGAFDMLSVGKPLSDEAVKAAQAEVGKAYTLPDAVLAGLHIRPLLGGHICSEYAARILVANGVLPPSWAKRAVTPGDLVEYLLNEGCVLQEVASV
jgi:hypothetical protein